MHAIVPLAGLPFLQQFTGSCLLPRERALTVSLSLSPSHLLAPQERSNCHVCWEGTLWGALLTSDHCWFNKWPFYLLSGCQIFGAVCWLLSQSCPQAHGHLLPFLTASLLRGYLGPRRLAGHPQSPLPSAWPGLGKGLWFLSCSGWGARTVGVRSGVGSEDPLQTMFCGTAGTDRVRLSWRKFYRFSMWVGTGLYVSPSTSLEQKRCEE